MAGVSNRKCSSRLKKKNIQAAKFINLKKNIFMTGEIDLNR